MTCPFKGVGRECVDNGTKAETRLTRASTEQNDPMFHL